MPPEVIFFVMKEKKRGRLPVEAELLSSPWKVGCHKDKLEACLRGEPVYPVTLELDITTACNRKCPGCPSTDSPFSEYLDMAFIGHLFSLLGGRTKGLLLTGGEPTLSPDFPEVLRKARESGFEEIAVVTNGSFLTEEKVAGALLENATVVRVSLYDWQEAARVDLHPTLRAIRRLRSRIERDGSPLEIGVSVLTTNGNAAGIPEIATQVRSSGAHWIYFHPLCIRWDAGTPTRVSQEGVPDIIEACRRDLENDFRVFFFRERYQPLRVGFEGYHAAHFLLVIGADGMNYLGAEVKYRKEHVIARPGKDRAGDFLWSPDRLERIRRVRSGEYAAIGSLHRGILYSDVIERLIRDEPAARASFSRIGQASFGYTHIL